MKQTPTETVTEPNPEPETEPVEPIENPEGFCPTAAIMSKEIPCVTCVP